MIHLKHIMDLFVYFLLYRFYYYEDRLCIFLYIFVSGLIRVPSYTFALSYSGVINHDHPF